MKVIFLDIDGVLNLIPQDWDKFGGIFNQHFVNNLGKIIDATEAKIVISSTWRLSGLKTMQDMWAFRGLPGEVIDITPTAYYHTDLKISENENPMRGHEIRLWLENNPPVENYVILDDDTDILSEQMNNFVITSGNEDHKDCIDIGYGLTNICTDKAIKILNNNEKD